MKSFIDELSLYSFRELEWFEDDEEASEALRLTRKKILPHLFWAMPTLSLAYLGTSAVIRPLIPLPSLLSSLLFVGGFLATGFYLVVLPLRRWMSRDLRKQLCMLGMPICLRCGCNLGEQADDTCPECNPSHQESPAASATKPKAHVSPSATSAPVVAKAAPISPPPPAAKAERGFVRMLGSFMIGLAIMAVAYIAILKYGETPQKSEAATPPSRAPTDGR